MRSSISTKNLFLISNGYDKRIVHSKCPVFIAITRNFNFIGKIMPFSLQCSNCIATIHICCLDSYQCCIIKSSSHFYLSIVVQKSCHMNILLIDLTPLLMELQNACLWDYKMSVFTMTIKETFL